MRAFLFLCLLATACQGAAAPVTGDAPQTCKTDDDCNIGCGPCTSGTVIKASDRSLGCAVNPCPTAVGVCGADHTCRVK